MLIRKGSRVIRTEDSVPGDVDKDMVEELSLIINNTRSLYNQTRALVDNLVNYPRASSASISPLLEKLSV